MEVIICSLFFLLNVMFPGMMHLQNAFKTVDEWLKVHVHQWCLKHTDKNRRKCTLRYILSYMKNLFRNYGQNIIQKQNRKHTPQYTQNSLAFKNIFTISKNYALYWNKQSSMALFPWLTAGWACKNIKHWKTA